VRHAVSRLSLKVGEQGRSRARGSREHLEVEHKS
jgi:hypothetical protein